jgi:hypothetical protein
MPTDTWEDKRAPAAATDLQETFVERLGRQGVLDEAEQLWDALDRGDDPFDTTAPVDDVIATARARRRAAG